jgi:hypothetical protein
LLQVDDRRLCGAGAPHIGFLQSDGRPGAALFFKSARMRSANSSRVKGLRSDFFGATFCRANGAIRSRQGL